MESREITIKYNQKASNSNEYTSYRPIRTLSKSQNWNG